VTDTHTKMAFGVAWMVGARLAVQMLGVISTLILARLLLPADFGLLAMATSVIALLELMRAFGFDLAIIQREEVDRTHFDSAWTLSVIVGAAIAILIIALAPATAAFYREERLTHILYALAAGWFVDSFMNIGTVAFRRELKFRKEFLFMIAKKLAGFVITLPLAFWLRSYWALVIGIVAGRSLSVLLSYWVHPYRPRFSLAAARDLLSFSGWVLISNSLVSMNLRAMDFVVGRFAGPTALGLFNLSYEISNMPSTELASPINRALIPGYSALVRERASLGKAYLDVLGLQALLSVPAGIGIAALAEPLVTVLLGDKWLDAIPLIGILGLYGAVVSLSSNQSPAILALGRPRILTILAGARLALLLPALVFGVEAMGVIGAALAVLCVTAVITPLNFIVLLPIIGARLVDCFGHIWRPIAASAGMYWLVTESIDVVTWFHSSSPPVQPSSCSADFSRACWDTWGSSLFSGSRAAGRKARRRS
jgi:O-antigen/teichoic acid export membrane protein